ncbi:hypothetical protein BpHYR1_037281 [Brachionus plicatilis]|uniref:Uncharacterized protein n=1 Tax=Brachionus plicatilis TaxID=10195 RepID=A0A3M7QMA3_BRAPC|nr:hypothetical protein BpHYR1_037281 [Brachionus plicatilis]
MTNVVFHKETKLIMCKKIFQFFFNKSILPSDLSRFDKRTIRQSLFKHYRLTKLLTLLKFLFTTN